MLLTHCHRITVRLSPGRKDKQTLSTTQSRAEAEPVQLRLLPGGGAHHRRPRRRRQRRRPPRQHRRHGRRRRPVHNRCAVSGLVSGLRYEGSFYGYLALGSTSKHIAVRVAAVSLLRKVNNFEF